MITALLAFIFVGLFCGFYLPFKLPKPFPQNKTTTFPSNISVIIPARNEEKNLALLLETLKNQYSSPKELIVIDDHSTDQTFLVATEKGAKVIQAPKLPPQWTGKNWACHQGSQVAIGEFLLFLDADVRLYPDALIKIENLLDSRLIDAFSLLPFHTVKNFYEEFSAFFNILMAVGSGPHLLTGPSLALSKEKYLQSGGHEAVSSKILENFSLSKKMLEKNFSLRNFSGQGILNYRMYPNGLMELINGWEKAFSNGAQITPKPTLIITIFWLSGLISNFILLIFSPVALLSWLTYGIFVLQIAYLLSRLGTYRKITALLYPFFLFFFFVVFARSLTKKILGRNVTWRGRDLKS